MLTRLKLKFHAGTNAFINLISSIRPSFNSASTSSGCVGSLGSEIERSPSDHFVPILFDLRGGPAQNLTQVSRLLWVESCC